MCIVGLCFLEYWYSDVGHPCLALFEHTNAIRYGTLHFRQYGIVSNSVTKQSSSVFNQRLISNQLGYDVAKLMARYFVLPTMVPVVQHFAANWYDDPNQSLLGQLEYGQYLHSVLIPLRTRAQTELSSRGGGSTWLLLKLAFFPGAGSIEMSLRK
jgi:hypothetical protein